MKNSLPPRNLEQDLDTLGQSLAPEKSLAPALLAQLQPLPKQTPHSLLTRKWIMRTTLGLAAAIILTALAVTLLLPPTVAFGQVMQKVEQTKTLTCDYEGEEKMHIACSGKLIRAELPDGTVSIGDLSTGQWLMLNEKENTAAKINMAKPLIDLYSWFKDFKNGKEEPLGEKTLNGQRVVGFKVTRATDDNSPVLGPIVITLWVDPATSLPVEAEGTEAGQKITITHFKWDQPLDEKLFAMTVPADYKVQDMGGITADQLMSPLAAREAQDAKSKAVLKEPLKELAFEKQGLEKIFTYLSRWTNVNIVVNWKELEAVGIDRNTPVSGDFHEIQLGQAITTLLAGVGANKATLGYTVNDGIVTISTLDDLNATATRSLLLKPGIGIGDLKFGDSPDTITKLLGEPEAISSKVGWDYPSRGFSLTVLPETGLTTVMAGSKKPSPASTTTTSPAKPTTASPSVPPAKKSKPSTASPTAKKTPATTTSRSTMMPPTSGSPCNPTRSSKSTSNPPARPCSTPATVRRSLLSRSPGNRHWQTCYTHLRTDSRSP